MYANLESFIMGQSPKIRPFSEMGDRIIKVREATTQLSQSDMTKALGLKEPTYGNYERGDRKMPPHVMEKFKKLTGCLSDFVYLGVGPMTMADALREEREASLDVSRLDEDLKKTVEDAFRMALEAQKGRKT